MSTAIVRVKPFCPLPGIMFSLKHWSETHAGKLVTLKVFKEKRSRRYCNSVGLVVPVSMFTLIPPAKLIGEIFRDVETELASARKKYPSNRFMLAALTEEVGESAQAMIDHSFGKDTVQHIYQELIQTMTVSLRLILEGSQEFTFKGIAPNVKPDVAPPEASSIGDGPT